MHNDLPSLTRSDWQVGDTLTQTIGAMRPGSRSGPDLADLRRQFMLIGGFPELLTSLNTRSGTDDGARLLESQQTLRSDAVERAIYKDIPQSFGVDNPMVMERLLYVLAAQVTGVLSPSKLCSELGISQPTFDRYLSYLRDAFLIFTLPNYSGRETNVQKRGRKLYFVDGAIRNAALQRGLAPLDNPIELGNLLENLFAATLHALSLQTGVRLHHWRDGKHEVDLVYDHPDEPLAFEIGSSPDHHRSGLDALIERYPRFHGRSYLVTPQSVVSHASVNPSGVGTLPLDDLLVAISAQASSGLLRRLGSSV